MFEMAGIFLISSRVGEFQYRIKVRDFDFGRLEGWLDLEALTGWRSAGGGDRLTDDGSACYRGFTSKHLGISSEISSGIWICIPFLSFIL